MNYLTVYKTFTDINSSWEDILKAMENAEWNSLENVNWAEYDYCPHVQFRMLYSHQAFFLQYKIKEQSVRAVATTDNGEVWKDSCVEFFISPNQDDGIYYNFEFNCIGTCLIAAGIPHQNRDFATPEKISSIRRLPDLGFQPFEERKNLTEWQLSVVIPYSSFFKHPDFSPEGKEVHANFYKCGDELTIPHFLSWNPVKTEKPDFHRPEFFGKIKFV